MLQIRRNKFLNRCNILQGLTTPKMEQTVLYATETCFIWAPFRENLCHFSYSVSTDFGRFSYTKFVLAKLMQNFIYTFKKMFRYIFVLFITVHILGQLVITHDVFTALPDMEALLKNELVTADIIDRYVKEEINRLEKLKQ